MAPWGFFVLVGWGGEDRGEGGEVHHRSWLTRFERSFVPFVSEGCGWEEGRTA